MYHLKVREGENTQTTVIVHCANLGIRPSKNLSLVLCSALDESCTLLASGVVVAVESHRNGRMVLLQQFEALVGG